jgi:hypothetical protein
MIRFVLVWYLTVGFSANPVSSEYGNDSGVVQFNRAISTKRILQLQEIYSLWVLPLLLPILFLPSPPQLVGVRTAITLSDGTGTNVLFHGIEIQVNEFALLGRATLVAT